ncbi:unnamed protein product, partial [Cylicostephanus goldi]
MTCKEIPRCEVSQHCTPDDAWMIIRNDVLDVTSFFDEHPGGMEIMLEYVSFPSAIGYDSLKSTVGIGSDATDAFES